MKPFYNVRYKMWLWLNMLVITPPWGISTHRIVYMHLINFHMLHTYKLECFQWAFPSWYLAKRWKYGNHILNTRFDEKWLHPSQKNKWNSEYISINTLDHVPNPVFRYECALLILFLLLENFHMFSRHKQCDDIQRYTFRMHM